MFAICAAVVALLVILGVDIEDALWWWLGFIALHFAFGGGWPLAWPWRARNPNG